MTEDSKVVPGLARRQVHPHGAQFCPLVRLSSGGILPLVVLHWWSHDIPQLGSPGSASNRP
eukprot:11514810-Heterocapsa_arctica.AAC.1